MALALNKPKLTEKERAKLVKELELNPRQCPFSNATDWTLRSVYAEDHALLEENFRAYINGFSKNVDDIIEHFNYRATIGLMVKNNLLERADTAEEKARVEKYVTLHGQELSPTNYAVCQADLLIKNDKQATVHLGNSLIPHDPHSKEPGDQWPEPKWRFNRMLSNPPFGVTWGGKDGYEKEARKLEKTRYTKGWAKGYADEQVKIFPCEDFAYHKVSVVFWQTDEHDRPASITEPYEKAFTAANVKKEMDFHDCELTFRATFKVGRKEKLVELTVRPGDNVARKFKDVLGEADDILSPEWTHRHYVADDEYIPHGEDIEAFLKREIAKPIIR
jgi:hypothetical protein